MFQASNNIDDILTEVEFSSLSIKRYQEISKYIACLQENRKAYSSSIRVIHINQDSNEGNGETHA